MTSTMGVFDYQVRVRYGETDRMGISYYAHYFAWFEAARTEYFRALGIEYTAFEAEGIRLPVIEAHCRYLAPSTYDDALTVRTVVSQLKQSSIRFEYHILNNGQPAPIAIGYTVHVFSDGTFKPIRIPERVKSKVTLAQLTA